MEPPFHPYLLSKYLCVFLRNHKRCNEYEANHFVVAGSYPASVWARGASLPLDMKYHDIDVYVASTQQVSYDRNKRGDSWGPKLVAQWTESRRIGNRFVDINIVILEDPPALEFILDCFDINAVFVGFQVWEWLMDPRNNVDEKDLLLDSGDMVSMCYDNVSPLLYKDFLNDIPTDLSIVLKWVIRRPFLSFLSSRTLRIMNHTSLPNCSASIIRLVYKSQDLELDMDFPQGELYDMYFKRSISNGNMWKYDALRYPYREFIDRNFVISHEVNDNDKSSTYHYLNPRNVQANRTTLHRIRDD